VRWRSADVANRFASRGLARIMPGYESTIISTDDLIMRRGTILEGTARRGRPARAKVVDQHKPGALCHGRAAS
jgi:IS4 transposase